MAACSCLSDLSAAAVSYVEKVPSFNMEREECLDMDINGASSRKLQDNAFGAAVLREDRLCRLIQEEFGKQADLLQELSSQIRSAVEREMPLHGHRLHTFHTRESSFAHRPSPSSAKPSKADGDSERVGDLDSAKANSDGNGERGHSKEHSNSFPGRILKDFGLVVW